MKFEDLQFSRTRSFWLKTFQWLVSLFNCSFDQLFCLTVGPFQCPLVWLMARLLVWWTWTQASESEKSVYRGWGGGQRSTISHCDGSYTSQSVDTHLCDGSYTSGFKLKVFTWLIKLCSLLKFMSFLGGPSILVKFLGGPNFGGTITSHRGGGTYWADLKSLGDLRPPCRPCVSYLNCSISWNFTVSVVLLLLLLDKLGLKVLD